MFKQNPYEYGIKSKELIKMVTNSGCILHCISVSPKFDNYNTDQDFYAFDGVVYRLCDNVLYREDQLPVGSKELKQHILDTLVSTEIWQVHRENSDWSKNIVIFGENEEELLEVFFRKSEMHKYNNSISVGWKDKRFEKKYSDYFFGDNGIANYAKCGGDMW